MSIFEKNRPEKSKICISIRFEISLRMLPIGNKLYRNGKSVQFRQTLLPNLLSPYWGVPSIMYCVCMSVCLSYETTCRAGSYVCTYGAKLRIHLAEEYQSVQNKQAGKQQQMFSSRGFILDN